VQWAAAFVCLKEASDEPVWISCRKIAPGPAPDERGAVAHNIVSWRCIGMKLNEISSPFMKFEGKTLRARDVHMPISYLLKPED
jgi:hypothetical protein